MVSQKNFLKKLKILKQQEKDEEIEAIYKDLLDDDTLDLQNDKVNSIKEILDSQNMCTVVGYHSYY